MTDKERAAPVPQPEGNPLARRLEPPVRWMQIAMGWCLIGICLATTYEILARRLFGSSIQGVNEVGAYLLAIASTWGFSAALLQRAHSRVDFLFQYFPPAMQSGLNMLASVSLAGLAVFSAWQGWRVLSDTLRWQAHAATPLQTPLWIPQSLWLAGLVIFAGMAAAFAVHSLILLFVDRRRLDRFYGPPSLKEQIEIETQGALPSDGRAVL
ncbi:TRAP transporter small permease [Bosea sp. 117]|uniref:TRAP transporter small permease subunit n=1 Tax=Bosea sp. 117 TaxID=1125973 RepID=UPI0006899C11|nr:TRAP transporter small permease [Bosea sp. 117]